jgi:hypothetical protein
VGQFEFFGDRAASNEGVAMMGDEAAVHEFLAERHVLPRTDIQRLPNRPRTVTATWPRSDWQVLVGNYDIAAIRSAEP